MLQFLAWLSEAESLCENAEQEIERNPLILKVCPSLMIFCMFHLENIFKRVQCPQIRCKVFIFTVQLSFHSIFKSHCSNFSSTFDGERQYFSYPFNYPMISKELERRKFFVSLGHNEKKDKPLIMRPVSPTPQFQANLIG